MEHQDTTTTTSTSPRACLAATHFTQVSPLAHAPLGICGLALPLNIAAGLPLVQRININFTSLSTELQDINLIKWFLFNIQTRGRRLSGNYGLSQLVITIGRQLEGKSGTGFGWEAKW